ncbi:hypothetical protein Fcan01_20145 [Folsomia candida]|uniref:Uncharacterized protein n=1 Tax=Folsomia candida TaxID=158441 RepID=A0A226DK08_FOLCA|nr:hypothetical protein Fcan01_20145 [Folsomia candida]
MTKLSILSRVKHHLKLGNFIFGVPAKWDKSEGKMISISESKEKIVKAFTDLNILFIIARIWTMLTKEASLLERIVGNTLTSLAVVDFLLGYNPSDHAHMQFVNCIFSSEDIEPGKQWATVLTVLGFFFDVIEVGYYVIGASHAMHSNDTFPMSTWTAQLNPLLVRGEFLIFLQLSVCTAYYLLTVLLTGVTFLWIEIETFIKRCKTEIFDQAEYRKVQVFEKLLNSCIRESIFLKVALLVPAFQVIILYVTIKMSHAHQYFLTMAFLYVYLGSIGFTVLTFSAAGKVYAASQDWIAKSKTGERKKYGRKFHYSLIPLRLQFGRNFVEPLTPLVVQEFCIRQTISFLLVTN